MQAQTAGKSKGQLIEWFKKTDRAVLVATASFWEGISIEGDDLKLVIIDKIPFGQQDDPILIARQRFYETQKQKEKFVIFKELQIFPATIRLLQGFGRLIRTKTDTGAVAILDPRLTYSRYRSQILGALPPAAVVTDLQDERLASILGVRIK